MADLPLLVVFGATGDTGTHVVRHALEGGKVRVRAFVRSPDRVPAEFKDSPNFEIFEGDLADTDKVDAALEGAKYAISTAGNKALSKNGIMLKFVTAVAEAMPKHGVERFLYQAGAFSPAPGDPAMPLFVKIMGPCMIAMMGIGAMIKDNTSVIDFLQTKKDLNWVVTRPGLIKQGASKGKLKKSDRLSPSCMFVDLALFNLEAVMSGDYDGTCPYLTY